MKPKPMPYAFKKAALIAGRLAAGLSFRKYGYAISPALAYDLISERLQRRNSQLFFELPTWVPEAFTDAYVRRCSILRDRKPKAKAAVA